jgi:hypothetical protein
VTRKWTFHPGPLRANRLQVANLIFGWAAKIWRFRSTYGKNTGGGFSHSLYDSRSLKKVSKHLHERIGQHRVCGVWLSPTVQQALMLFRGRGPEHDQSKEPEQPETHRHVFFLLFACLLLQSTTEQLTFSPVYEESDTGPHISHADASERRRTRSRADICCCSAAAALGPLDERVLRADNARQSFAAADCE